MCFSRQSRVLAKPLLKKTLLRKTHKHFIVVAPTGIAALNAGGVYHSLTVLFPLGMFLPERNIPHDLDGK